MSRSTRELLLERGAVAPEVLVRAEAEAARTGRRLCSQLLVMAAADERVLAEVLAVRHGLPGVDLSRSAIPTSALELVPRGVAETDGILPLSTEGGRLHLALASPEQAERTLAEVRFVTGLEVSTYVAVEESLRRTITAAYQALEQGAPEWRGFGASGPSGQVEVVLPGEIQLPEGDEVIEVGEADVEMVGADEALAGAGAAPSERTAEAPIEVGVGDDEEVVHQVSAGAGPSARRRVLVVDDEPEIRLLVERALVAQGYEVDTAADGEEGLAKVQARPPDLLLLDAMLPKMHGFEVARRIRADAGTRQVPIVMMTAIYRGWRFAQDARENYGAQDYIEKPFRLDDFTRRVEAVLEATASRPPPQAASAEPWFRKGKELLLAGKLDESLQALEAGLALDPFSAEAHYQLAKVLRAKGEHFRAMTSFERAVELRPSHFPALRSLAALYTEKGFRRKAAETLERALAAAPDATTRDAIKSDLLELLGA